MVLMLGYDADTYRDSIKDLLEHSALKELDRDGTADQRRAPSAA